MSCIDIRNILGGLNVREQRNVVLYHLIQRCFFPYVGLAKEPKLRAIQKTYTASGPITIPGGDGATSAVVTNVVLTLTRDYDTNNQIITYWNLSYHYYNGAYRWEDIQYLYIDFVNSLGITLVSSPAISAQTASSNCHYNGGINQSTKGTMNFDFTLVSDMHIAGSGATTVPGQSNKNHKC